MDDVTTRNIMFKLNEWRKARQKCDVILIIGEQEFHAHKHILAAAVEFFDKLFTGDFAEKGKNVITLKDVDPNGFSLILDFIYTEEIKTDDDNFHPVLSVCAFYQIECLLKELFNYVKNRINADNAFYYYRSANSAGYEGLEQFTKEFIRKDFLSCSHSAAFLDITHSSLLEFIDSPIKNELDRFKIAMKWIQYDSNERSDYLSDLIRHVSFAYISNDEVVDEILDYQLIINNLKIIQTIKERKKTERTMWIYGMNGSDLIRVGIVKTEVVAIHVMAKTGISYQRFQIASSADAIYVCVYSNEGRGSNSLYCFKDSQWVYLTSDFRSNVIYESLVYSEKYKMIYLRSSSNTIHLCKVGCCFQNNEMKYDEGDCKRIRSICGLLICHNDLIYAAALAYDGLYYIIRYDPLTAGVHFTSQLLKPCPEAVSAVLGDKMFIVSGVLVQMYDITENLCSLMDENAFKDVSYHSLIGYRDRLYAIRKTWDMIDVFDPAKKRWTEQIHLTKNKRIFDVK